MAQACIESIVKERYGSKPFRVFRLLMMKKLLEQKQVSDMALIPQKEAKEMLYSLLAENFVSLQVGYLGGSGTGHSLHSLHRSQEIPRTADYAPSRTYYLFSVNLQQVARTVLLRCYKVPSMIVIACNVSVPIVYRVTGFHLENLPGRGAGKMCVSEFGGAKQYLCITMPVHNHTGIQGGLGACHLLHVFNITNFFEE